MIALYLWLQFWRACFWIFAGSIWLCLAFGGWAFVLTAALIALPFDRRVAARMVQTGSQRLAPPRYLRIKSHT